MILHKASSLPAQPIFFGFQLIVNFAFLLQSLFTNAQAIFSTVFTLLYSFIACFTTSKFVELRRESASPVPLTDETPYPLSKQLSRTTVISVCCIWKRSPLLTKTMQMAAAKRHLFDLADSDNRFDFILLSFFWPFRYFSFALKFLQDALKVFLLHWCGLFLVLKRLALPLW